MTPEVTLRRDVGKYSLVSTRAPESDTAPVDRSRSARKGVWLDIGRKVWWPSALARAEQPSDQSESQPVG